jgi:transcriptional regulator with XRE-family HTH domain
MKDTTPRNPEQLGRAIRLKRLEKGISQNVLAAQIGVGRKWVIHLEAGNQKAELGLVLKALDALQLQATLGEATSTATGNANRSGRLDEVFNRLQRPRK